MDQGGIPRAERAEPLAGLGSSSYTVGVGGADLQDAGDGSQALSSGKPVWSVDQIVANLMRWDARWEAPLSIPFSFYETQPAHLAKAPNWQGFVALDAAQRLATRTVLDLLSDVANVKFVEVPDDGADPGPAIPRLTYARADWGHANATALANVDISSAPLLGDAREIHAAEISLNTQRWTGPALPSSREFYVLIHETMHALGFPHPGKYDGPGKTYAEHAEYSQDTGQYTVLSYFSAKDSGADHKGAYPSTPMLHDIAALQAVYGPNMTTRAGDTTYGFGSNAGRSVYDFAVNARPVMSIWDAGGIDTINLSGFFQPARLDLNAGAFSDVAGMIGNLSIAFGVVIENANGGSADDRIAGNAAGNHLRGEGGNDNIFGRDGDDLIGGQDGDDFIDGGNGRDSLFGDAGRDHMVGGADGDRLHGQDGDDLIGGQDGDDFIDGGAGRDSLFGDAGGDHIIGGAEGDRLHGQDGDDLIGGQDGDDFIDGGAGRDSLFGDAGGDHMIGGGEGDRLHGQDGDDLIGGQDGDDFIDGGAGRDSLFGDAGNDHIIGGFDADRLHGQDGDDLIGGQDGDDYIEGGVGRDTLFGDGGADVLFGGAGGDILVGQGGADVFIFMALSDSLGPEADRIIDFEASDRIDISRIDADASAEGDQAFIFVGEFQAGRTGQARLSFDAGANTTMLQLDADGDAAADFVLLLDGRVEASAAWVL